MSCGPVHVGFREAILAAVFQTCDRRSDLKRVVPIEIRPEAVFSRSDGLQQVLVHHIVGLLGDMQFEGKDLGVGVINAARGLVDICDPVRIDLVAEQITIFIVPVEPQIGWLEVLVVDELALDLEIGEMVIYAPILSSL